jgi:para-aminobenzoate synthetase component 2
MPERLPNEGRRPRVRVIDNYDSFTYNLVALLTVGGAEVEVLRNDSSRALRGLESCDGVLVSPGPGAPSNAGVSLRVIEQCLARGTPMLGVCLGHQALAEVLGGRVVRAARPMHGKTSRLQHRRGGLFAGVSARTEVMRYHSLLVAERSLPSELTVTATDRSTGEIMAIEHRTLPAWGLQFHPESILTPEGPQMIANWLGLLGKIRVNQ